MDSSSVSSFVLSCRVRLYTGGERVGALVVLVYRTRKHCCSVTVLGFRLIVYGLVDGRKLPTTMKRVRRHRLMIQLIWKKIVSV